jgi:hypothetical protein
LIDQVLLNSDGPSQEMRDEHLGKRRLVVEDPGTVAKTLPEFVALWHGLVDPGGGRP